MTLAYKSDEFFEPRAVQTADRKYLADKRFASRKRSEFRIETGIDEAPVLTITSVAEPSEVLIQSIQDTLNRVAAIKALDAGWDSYAGQRAQKEAIAPALKLALLAIQKCHPPRVELNSEGGIDLVWEQPGKTLSISVEGSDAFEVYYEEGEAAEEPADLVAWDEAARFFSRYCS